MQSYYLPMPDDQTLNLSIVLDGAERHLTFQESPASFPFDIYEAYRIRLISLMNGALYAIKHNKRLEEKDKTSRSAAISALYKDKMEALNQFKAGTTGHPVSFQSELYTFYAKELPNASGFSAKQLLLAESFYVWQELPRPQRTTEYYRNLDTYGKLRIQQIVHPRHTDLTENQKTELCRIIQPGSEPAWFLQLDAWAQDSLRELVTKANSKNDWSDYTRAHPTFLRHIPGEANAADYRLILSHITSSGEVIILSDTFAAAQGVPTSFNMPTADRQNSATENLTQLLLAKTKDAKENFQGTWGLEAATPLSCKIPVLLGGLITPSNQAGLSSKLLDAINASGAANNTTLAHEKEKALECYLAANPNNDLRFFNLNVPLNSYLSVPIQPDAEFITFTRETHEKLSTLLALQETKRIEPSLLTTRKNNLTLLASVLQQLEALSNSTLQIEGRNRNFYLAALYDLATRLMGGLSTGNCKSSRDRKGSEILLAHSLLIYAAEEIAQGRPASIPAFNADPSTRIRLVDIYAELYTSGHHLLVAHDNCPGSLGLKNENVLDKDIIAALEKKREGTNSGVYTLSKQMANFNIPGNSWKKFGRTIQFYATAVLTTVAILTTIALLASGIFSPLAILGAAAAIKLGAAAMFLGGLINIATTALGTVALIAGICTIGSSIDAYHDKKTSFAAQLTKYKPASTGASSTAKMMNSFSGPTEPAATPTSKPAMSAHSVAPPLVSAISTFVASPLPHSRPP